MLRIIILGSNSNFTIGLEKAFKELQNEIAIENILSSVKDAIAWLESHKAPDIIYSDTVLNDGISFDVFKKVKVSCPIVFYTSNKSITVNLNNEPNNLLAPKTISNLEKLITELKGKQHQGAIINNINKDMQRLVESCDSRYQSVILCHNRDQIIPLATDSIKYISNKNRLTNAYTEGRYYIINKTLDQLMSRLNPYKFFHANRNYIIHRDAIQIITKQPGRKLDIKLALPDSPVISISKDKATEFKKWLEGYIPWN